MEETNNKMVNTMTFTFKEDSILEVKSLVMSKSIFKQLDWIYDKFLSKEDKLIAWTNLIEDGNTYPYYLFQHDGRLVRVSDVNYRQRLFDTTKEKFDLELQQPNLSVGDFLSRIIREMKKTIPQVILK